MRSRVSFTRRSAAVAAIVLFQTTVPVFADDDVAPTANAVRGVVFEVGGTTALPGAEVRLVELGRVVFADADGRFEFRRVPRGTFTLGVHLAGFSSHHGAVRIPLADELTIELSPTRFEDEITVSASPFAVNRLEVAQQVDIVSGEDVKRDSTASLGQALSTTPGVANIPTGEGLGTPVIRGLSENRIRVLNDGIPLNHQQFSWRHSPNVEASLANSVEVVRGPASVLYGPDAMGGVINVIQSPLLVSHGDEPVVHGEVAAGWGSNADEFTGRAEAEGAIGAFGWNIGLVHRDSGNITTPDKELDNTDFDQTNGNVSVGLTGSWGTARLRANHWELDTGFYRPQDFRLGLQDDLVAADLFVPTTIGDVEVTAAHQTNSRQAYPAALAGIAAVDLDLTTRTLRAGLHHRPIGAFRGRIAVESLRLENTESGPANLLPDYTSDGLAFMLFEEGRFLLADDGDHDRLIVSFGLRWDESDLDVPTDESRDLPDGFSADYSAVTGSVGVVYRLTPIVAVAGNLGYGWRPPNAFELFAKGVHNGVSAIQIGNPDLVEENNVNAELSVRFETERIRAYLTGYRNDFEDFIYIADSGETQDGLPVFVYRQADAVIEGIEASLEAAVLDWLHLGLTSTWIDTENRSTGNPLPQQPANRWGLHIEAGQRQLGALRNVSLGADVHLVDSQEVSGPDEPFGVATDSYTLVDLRAGFELPASGVTWGLDLTVRNLFDEAYTDFLYSYKAFAQNPGRDVRLVGRLRF